MLGLAATLFPTGWTTTGMTNPCIWPDVNCDNSNQGLISSIGYDEDGIVMMMMMMMVQHWVNLCTVNLFNVDDGPIRMMEIKTLGWGPKATAF